MNNDNWNKISIEANRLGAHELLFISGYRDVENKIKLQKKHPKLKKRIDSFLGLKDPFVEFTKARKSHKRWALFFLFLSALSVVIHPAIAGCLILLTAICSLFSEPQEKDFDFKNYGFKHE